jgi:surfactin synthase thioesterase subunit
MKQIALAALAAFALAAPSQAQAPSAQAQQEQQIVALVRELQAQQAAIADNQTKIEAKLAAVAEALRVARIYSSRAGQGGGNQ